VKRFNRKWEISIGLSLVALLTLAVRGIARAEEKKGEAGGRPLFDGTTFAGWEGNLDIFRIEDGAIVGGTMDKPVPHNDFLCAKGEYADFELTLKVKIKGNANGGIQLRSQRIAKPDYEMSGFQADMGWTFWGALYDESRRNKTLVQPDKALIDRILKKDDWNEYRIRCEGPRIQLWLNGTQTADYTETDDGIPRKGLIAVQIHGGAPSEAWYKDIVIREIK
jgi:hypothetical protein